MDSQAIEIHCDRQQTRLWCWVSVAQAVCRFVRRDPLPTQGELAGFVAGRGDCWCQPVPERCIFPVPPSLITALYGALGVNRDYLDTALPEPELLAELTAGRPVEAAFDWYGGGGHVAIINGFKITPAATVYSVSDPWFGDGWFAYQSLLTAYGSGVWAQSWGRFSLIKPR